MSGGVPSPAAARWTTALALGAILFATLTPSPSTVPPAGPWCLVCGDIGTVDALQNIVLFVPFGVGLALMGVGARRAVLLAFALTTTIELLQFWVIPGRDGTLGDVTMNTVGAALGAALVAWRANPFHPTVPAARWMRSAAVTTWTLIAALSTLGVKPQRADPPYAVVDPAFRASGTPSDIRVLRLWVDSQAIVMPPSGELPMVEKDLGIAHSTMAVDVATRGPRLTPERILHLVSREGSLYTFGQNDNAFWCSRSLLASLWRFRTPAIAVPAPVPESVAWIAGDANPVHLLCESDPDHLSITAVFGGRRAVRSIRLTPGSGWRLLLPGFLVPSELERTASWLNACWLILLALGLGYCALLPSIRAPTGTGRRRGAVARALGLLLLLVAVMQLMTPRLEGTAPSPWWEILASVAGLALGAAIATRFVPRGRVVGSEP